jgi:hypothetical protein
LLLFFRWGLCFCLGWSQTTTLWSPPTKELGL